MGAARTPRVMKIRTTPVNRRPYPANPCGAGTSVDIGKCLTMTVAFFYWSGLRSYGIV